MSGAIGSGQLAPLWELLPELLVEQRWFADKQRRPVAVRPAALFWLRSEQPAILIALVDVVFTAGQPTRYQLPLGVRTAVGGELSPGASTWAVYRDPGSDIDLVVSDALAESELADLLLGALIALVQLPGAVDSKLKVRLLDQAAELGSGTSNARPMALEQSNSLVVFEERLLLKVFRRIWPGINPELQLLEALDRAGFEGIAKPWLAIEATLDGQVHSLGMLQTYLRNGTDGFTMALTSLRDLQADLLPGADGDLPSRERCDEAVRTQGGSFVGSARELGALTARMHLALAQPGLGDELEPRPLTAADLEGAAERIRRHLDTLLQDPNPRLEPLRVHRARMRELLQRMATTHPEGLAIRIHGDYHLGQLLRTDAGWHVLDFEGRPAISIAERGAHATPLQDVAGMLRSFDYAAAVALRQQAHPDEATARTLAPYGRSWARIMREEFLGAYLQAGGGDGLAFGNSTGLQSVVGALEVGQALYEVEYEIRSRPEWLTIPLEGIARLLHEAEL